MDRETHKNTKMARRLGESSMFRPARVPQGLTLFGPEASWGLLGPFGAFWGPCWDLPGLSWSLLGSSWGHFVAIVGALGAILEPLGAILVCPPPCRLALASRALSGSSVTCSSSNSTVFVPRWPRHPDASKPPSKRPGPAECAKRLNHEISAKTLTESNNINRTNVEHPPT